MRSLALACAALLLACGGGTQQTVPPPPPDAGVPLAVTAVTPADGTTAVRRDAPVVIRFNRAATGVTSGCSGTVQLSDDGFATCAEGTFAGSDAGATWTFAPSALLHGSATYKVRVTTGVKDAEGVALAAEFTTGGFTTEVAAALTVSGVDLQHLFVAWTAPAGVSEVRLYLAPAGEAYTAYTSYSSAPGSAILGPLPPGSSWDLKLSTVRGGVETPASELRGIATAFAGTAAEWLPEQLVTGEKGGHFRLAWNGRDLFAAWSDGADAKGLEESTGDALWIAFDTDPDGDATGEVRTSTGSSSTPQIIWPFKADYVVELKHAGARLRSASTASWAPLQAATKLAPALSEIAFSRAALGNPAKVRFALAALARGAAFDLAPQHAGNEIPTTGRLASLTASLATDFSGDAAAAVRVPAPWLVTFAVAGPMKGPVQIAGDVPPLSEDLPLSEYQLHFAEIHSWDGRFNLGGASGELFFKFADAGATEPIFTPGKDRVYTLSGGRETIPALTWNTPYGAGASFHLVFDCSCSGATELRELIPAGGFATLASPFGGAAEVVFESRDLVGTPLVFQAFSGSPGYDTAHSMDDDVINTRTLTWTAGDGSSF